MSTARAKQRLRQTLCQTRENLSLAFQRESSEKICHQIIELKQFHLAKTISLYWPQQGEVDLRPLWHYAVDEGKECSFPVINPDKTLSFVAATPKTDFSKNRYGIPEPHPSQNKMIGIDNIDMMLTPLVAFDHLGTRLGMGGGYFDRTLAANRPKLLLGVAYEFQRQAFLSPEEWDIRLDAVITEKTIYWIPS